MTLSRNLCSASILFGSFLMFGQEKPVKTQTVPLYTVTVVQRTATAINYQYRLGPTMIDFRGTVLLSKAKGEATVESKRGRTEIEAKFENMAPPTRFGREYLTYVLWAITPDGAAYNIGEVIPDGSDKAKFHVTTDLQAFGLIVTAEPYSATRQPSDVVVLENEVRPDTVGQIQEIQANYDLMPRGHYVWQVPDELESRVANAPKVSIDQYEALLEVYEAQNAMEIARVARAGQYAAPTFDKAQRLLSEAQRLQANGSSRLAVQEARQAAQSAEDARLIAEKRQQEERITAAQAEAARAQQAKEQVLAEVQQARTEADLARAQAEADRTARARAEAEAAVSRDRVAEAEAAVSRDRVAEAEALHSPASNAPPALPPQPAPVDSRRTQLRVRVLEQLNGVFPTRDAPQGLVVTVPDSGFGGAELRPAVFGQIRRLSAILASYPGLRAEVLGHSDSAANGAMSWKRAEAMQRMLIAQGLPADRVSARGLGDSRPLGPNSSAAGREQNRRVEIVISGEPIGDRAYWDRPYSLTFRQ